MNDNIDEIDLISLKIIEKNTLKKSVREANERREDLARVLHRVENIYGEFEKPLPFNREFSTLFISNKKAGNGASIEMVEDVPTLEQMLMSHQSREKYLQQVTVFIVGYSKVAQDRLRLMQEVNQFFLSTEGVFDSYIAREEKILNEEKDESIMDKNDSLTMAIEDDEPDYTVSELTEGMQQSIDACHNLTIRLGELNNDIIECFAKYAQSKAGNKGKKKLEKALETAIAETNKLNERLAQTLKVISEKDGRIDSLMKQCEMKSKEVQKYKAAAESIKKAALEADSLREHLKERDIRIMKLESELIQTQIKIEEVKTVDAAQRANAEEMAKEFQEKSILLEKSLHDQKIEFEEMKREMSRQHSAQIKQVQADFEAKLIQSKSIHDQETKQLKSSEFDENAVGLQWSEPDNDIDKPLTKSLSTLSKNSSDFLNDSQDGTSFVLSKSHSLDIWNKDEKSPKSKGSSRIQSAINKVESPPHGYSGSSRSPEKDVWIFDDAPDIDEEDFWSNIPRNHLLGRFAQYRQMSRVARSTLQDEIEAHGHSTTRQIHSLKSQHQAHKRRWDEEREMLIDALKKMEEEKKDIQSYADSASEEMENFLAFMKSEDHTEDLNHLNMIEIAEYIRDYLKKQNLFNDPISSMITTLINKCQDFQEKTRISLPKFPTMLEYNKEKSFKKEMIEKILQTDIAKTVDSYAILDEHRDILLEDESEDNEGTRDVAISASPSLLRIALGFYSPHADRNEEPQDEGVTSKDLELPSNFVDIQDRTGLGLIQHPIVVDYLNSYDHILTFKEHFISILEDIAKVESSDIDILRDLKPISIKSKSRIIPQIEEIGKSIEKILFKSEELIEKLLLPAKKKGSQSKVDKIDQHSQLSIAKGKQVITSKTKTNYTAYFTYVSGECNDMKIQIKAMKHSFVIKFNVINNSIMKLRNLISSAMVQRTKETSDDNENKEDKNKMEVIDNPNTLGNVDSVSILFTRKDSENNLRRMNQAMLENRINDGMYEEAIERMSEYTEIPAKRLLVLVKKYVQQTTMQRIAEYVKQHNKFDSDTFKILDKMEISNERKLDRYRELQEYFRKERILRAQAMIETFDKMQSCSIFLIRPVLSKSSRQQLRDIITLTNLAEETENLKHKCLVNYQKAKHSSKSVALPTKSKEEIQNTSFDGGKMWMPDYSLDGAEYNPLTLIESKLFEIDTNRMLLPLNNVSTTYSHDGQVVLPPNVAVRSYVAVAHPTLVDMNLSPQPSTTPYRDRAASDSASKSRLSRDLSKHAPLPPITPILKNPETFIFENSI